MPSAINDVDDRRVYYEDDGGPGAPVVFHGGFGEPVALVRVSPIARALDGEGYRCVYVDHRGHGRSDKPHDPAAYALPVRVADTVAVLDHLQLDRAHVVGTSWGGRLAFGIGEHAPDRVSSLVIGGQQPYRWPDTPLIRVVTEALSVARRQRRVDPLVEALEGFWNITFPAERRELVLRNDPLALAAAWQAALDEDPISEDLGAWEVPCLIFIGAADVDLLDLARRAAEEIPSAEFLTLGGRDHYGAHTGAGDPLLAAVVRTLRRAA